MKDFVKKNNSFKNMGFIKFWLISSLFFMTFPLSLIFCFLYLGTTKTKQFLIVLANEFLQTLLILFITLSIMIYFIFDYIGNFFLISYFGNLDFRFVAKTNVIKHNKNFGLGYS